LDSSHHQLQQQLRQLLFLPALLQNLLLKLILPVVGFTGSA
jgi:hypothetical protein